MEYIISVILIALSALFSGLTLGLLSLDVHTLRRQAEHGNKDAQKVYAVRKKGNLLLTTLLLGNVAVNTALSVFLGTIVSGVVAGFAATTLIFLFGEIIPQAVISRYALPFGARVTWFVRIVIVLFYPITFPIAWTLDKALGEELPTIYSNHELMQIISEHEQSEHSPIDTDEKRILHGALTFSHTRVDEVMTPQSEVEMYEETRILDDALREEINESGYSRFPVFRKNRENIVGVLFAKDILTEDENIPVSKAQNAFDDSFLIARPNEMLDAVLSRMLKRKQHLAVVTEKDGRSVGVITLEDIIEEIIQHEIEDEDDHEDTLKEKAA